MANIDIWINIQNETPTKLRVDDKITIRLLKAALIGQRGLPAFNGQGDALSYRFNRVPGTHFIQDEDIPISTLMKNGEHLELKGIALESSDNVDSKKVGINISDASNVTVVSSGTGNISYPSEKSQVVFSPRKSDVQKPPECFPEIPINTRMTPKRCELQSSNQQNGEHELKLAIEPGDVVLAKIWGILTESENPGSRIMRQLIPGDKFTIISKCNNGYKVSYEAGFDLTLTGYVRETVVGKSYLQEKVKGQTDVSKTKAYNYLENEPTNAPTTNPGNIVTLNMCGVLSESENSGSRHLKFLKKGDQVTIISKCEKCYKVNFTAGFNLILTGYIRETMVHNAISQTGETYDTIKETTSKKERTFYERYNHEPIYTNHDTRETISHGTQSTFYERSNQNAVEHNSQAEDSTVSETQSSFYERYNSQHNNNENVPKFTPAVLTNTEIITIRAISDGLLFELPEYRSTSVSGIIQGDILVVNGEIGDFFEATLQTGEHRGKSGFVDKSIVSH